VGEWNTARLTEDSVTFAFDGDADLERLIRFLGPVLIRPLNRRWEAKKLIISAPNEVDEQRYVRIGGIDQWMTIRGENRDNPALLFLHGGPGAGHTMFNSLTRAWERHFTIVQWDQRGSGKTRRKNGPLGPRELTLMRLEEDGLQVVDYVRSYLNQEKIVLVASSVGSTFGLAMAKRRPDLFVAYVGTDQTPALMHRGFHIAHAHMASRIGSVERSESCRTNRTGSRSLDKSRVRRVYAVGDQKPTGGSRTWSWASSFRRS
jgi:pimeloyl-ACP methyl ester carboxylesterase